MARYRKIDPRIWNDAKFSSLTERGKLVFLYFLTHPHMTSLGAMRASLDGLAAEIQMPAKGFREGFGELFRKGLARGDQKAALLWAPNFMKYNPPDNPNVVKAWVNAWDLLPECGLKNDVGQAFKEFLKGLPKGFAEGLPKGFAEPFAKGLANQEQEQEQEKEPEQKAQRARANGHVMSRFDEFWDAYPSKVGKGDARKAWETINPPDELAASMLSAIAEQRESERWQRGFVPNPATWLRQGRWDDALPHKRDKIRNVIEEAERLTFGEKQ